ncbi:MAG: hypothetical protein U9Q68_09585 [Euryarchaeota archaeon]|nr:hypothetical protein [Euryarchaeota archaeon]
MESYFLDTSAFKQNQYPAIALHVDRIIHVKDGLLINENMNI